MADDSCGELAVGSKQLSSLRVIDLKTELEKRGLPKSGSKKELLERLKRQLQLENLQQKASQNEDQVPNLSLQDDDFASQNDLVKQYLAGQQRIYELQKEARRKIERDDAHRASDTEASSSQDEGCSTRDESPDTKETAAECITPSRTLRLRGEKAIKVDEVKAVIIKDVKEDGKKGVKEEPEKFVKQEIKLVIKTNIRHVTRDDVDTKRVVKDDTKQAIKGKLVTEEDEGVVKVIQRDDKKEEPTSHVPSKKESEILAPAQDVPEDLSSTSFHIKTVVKSRGDDQSVQKRSDDPLERASDQVNEKMAVTHGEAEADTGQDKVVGRTGETKPVVVQMSLGENRDELEMAVGSISIEREEMTSSFEEVVVGDVVRTECSLQLGGREVMDETAEACRVITEVPSETGEDETAEACRVITEMPVEVESFVVCKVITEVPLEVGTGQEVNDETAEACRVIADQSPEVGTGEGGQEEKPETGRDITDAPLKVGRGQEVMNEATEDCRVIPLEVGRSQEVMSETLEACKIIQKVPLEVGMSEKAEVLQEAPQKVERGQPVVNEKAEVCMVTQEVPQEVGRGQDVVSKRKEVEVPLDVGGGQEVSRKVPLEVRRDQESTSEMAEACKVITKLPLEVGEGQEVIREVPLEVGKDREVTRDVPLEMGKGQDVIREVPLEVGKGQEVRKDQEVIREVPPEVRGQKGFSEKAEDRRVVTDEPLEVERGTHVVMEKTDEVCKVVSDSYQESTTNDESSSSSSQGAESPVPPSTGNKAEVRKESSSEDEGGNSLEDTMGGTQDNHNGDKDTDGGAQDTSRNVRDRGTHDGDKKDRDRVQNADRKVKDRGTHDTNRKLKDEGGGAQDMDIGARDAHADVKDGDGGAQDSGKDISEGVKEEGRVPNGTHLSDSQKDVHVLDLHPGDMDIGSALSSEDPKPETEEKPEAKHNTLTDRPVPPPRNITNRKLSLSGSRESKEGKEESRPQRKRRWGAITSKSTPSISTESLKDLIPDYKPQLSALAEEVLPSMAAPTIEDSPDEASQEPPEKMGSLEKAEGSMVKAEPVGPVHVVERRFAPRPPSPSVAPQRKEERSPSPAKNPASRILFIRNLVRPFTLPQLKEVLARTGTFQTDAFWIDKIKSKCYVMYETEDEAVKTRSALHGCRWPTSNPKTLLVDFSTEEELNFHKQLGDSPGLPPVQRGTTQRSEDSFHRLDKNMTVVVSQNVPPAPPATARTAESHTHREVGEKRRTTSSSSESRSRPVPIREWDRDKLVQEHHRESSKQSRETKERPSRKEKKELVKRKEEPPGKLLDDLFRKTKAVPCIYWLPLTESAVVQREVEKKQWEADREKRREKRQEGDGERKPRPLREALKPLPPPMLTGGNVAPLKGRDFSGGRSRSPVRRR